MMDKSTIARNRLAQKATKRLSMLIASYEIPTTVLIGIFLLICLYDPVIMFRIWIAASIYRWAPALCSSLMKCRGETIISHMGQLFLRLESIGDTYVAPAVYSHETKLHRSNQQEPFSIFLISIPPHRLLK